MTFLRSAIKSALLPLVVALIAYGLSPTDSAKTKLAVAALTFIVPFVLLMAPWAWARRVRGAIAVAVVRASLYAMRSSGAAWMSDLGGDNRWDWLTDELLAVQRRYAFSMGCLVFRYTDDGVLQCLMRRREPPGGGTHKVILWPGGRTRGSLADFELELTRMVQNQTGCTVELVSTDLGTATAFATALLSYNPKTQESDVENMLLQPPILVMQQNRLQAQNVPGHLDLLYLARVGNGTGLRDPGFWLDVAGIDGYDERQLWLDTRDCVLRAARMFTAAGPHAPAKPPTEPPSGS